MKISHLKSTCVLNIKLWFQNKIFFYNLFQNYILIFTFVQNNKYKFNLFLIFRKKQLYVQFILKNSRYFQNKSHIISSILNFFFWMIFFFSLFWNIKDFIRINLLFFHLFRNCYCFQNKLIFSCLFWIIH